MRFPIDGVKVGHWDDQVARTGCTVVLLPEGTVASGAVRGGAPATRDFSLLSPERQVAQVNAVLMTGGSVFGLAAADGVVGFLEEQGVGFPTGAGPIPIVVGMGLFDLLAGEPGVRPGPEQGRAAVESASEEFLTGVVGAGTGATVGKWAGRDKALPGGLGFGVTQKGEVMVAALAAVNALGQPDDGTQSAAVSNGTFTAWPTRRDHFQENTTLITVVTNAVLSKMDCFLLAQSGHDGLARAIFPPHLGSDGDAVVAAATGKVEADSVDVVRALVVAAVEQAVHQAC